MRIEVLPEVMEILADATEQVGSTQVSVISRLLEWFVKQSDVTQAAILGLYPADIHNELPRMILNRVVLPLPLGPKNPKISPYLTSKSKSTTAGLPEKLLDKC